MGRGRPSKPLWEPGPVVAPRGPQASPIIALPGVPLLSSRWACPDAVSYGFTALVAEGFQMSLVAPVWCLTLRLTHRLSAMWAEGMSSHWGPMGLPPQLGLLPRVPREMHLTTLYGFLIDSFSFFFWGRQDDKDRKQITGSRG